MTKKPLGNADKLAAFDEVLKGINSQFKSETGGKIIAKLGDKPNIQVKTISTGSLVLDSILGGGFPEGRIIEIYGPEASGKTSIALTAAGNVQRDGGTVAFIDLEHALDPNYAKKLGVDVSNLALAQPDYAEQALDMVESLAATGVVDLIIVDSVAALVPKSELEGTMEDHGMAVVARMLSKALRRLVGTASKNKTTVIFINQIREKVGFVMGNPEATTGGKALKFYASQRIRISRTGEVKEGKIAIGNTVKMKVQKNKINRPFLDGTTVLTYNRGINRPAEMIEVGATFGILERPNSRTYIEAETGETIGTSKASAIEAIEKDPKLFARLSKALATSIAEDEDNKGGMNEKDIELETNDETVDELVDSVTKTK